MTRGPSTVVRSRRNAAIPAVTTPVLMYHRIADESSPAMRRFTVSPAAFGAQLRQLRQAGYTGMTVSDWVRIGREEPQRMPSRPVVLTFDDGYADFEQHAWPLLQTHGFAATLYVVAGRAGGCSDWLPGSDARLPLLDWPALIRLQHAGIEIGAHSMTHLALDGLDEAALEQEVVQPREQMARAMGVAPDSFCYPFGFCNARVRAAVARAGYASACAVRYATASTAGDPLMIARHIVTSGMSADDFGALLAHPTPLRLVWRDRLRSRTGALARKAGHTWMS